MEQSNRPGQGFEPQPDVSSLGDPLDSAFCEDVFGRQISMEELDAKFFSINVKDFGQDMDVTVEKIELHQSWDVVRLEDKLGFKMAVATCQTDTGLIKHILFLHEDTIF